MSLSNWPDYLLIQEMNRYVQEAIDAQGFRSGPPQAPDLELDLRKPDIASWYFGDCDGQVVFIPSEPEYDSERQPILSEMMGYNDKGGEVWS